MPSNTTRLIQITDTHLFEDKKAVLLGRDVYASLQAVSRLVQQYESNFDAIVLTGDLSQDGSRASYQHLMAIGQSFDVPVYWIPGNHDNREMMNKTLGSVFETNKHLILNDWLIIFADSACEGKVSGLMSPNELERIKKLIDQHSQKNLLIFLHHPPFPIHSKWLDKINLQNSREFLEIVGQHTKPVTIISGHVHQEISIFNDGFLFFATPSSCVQFKPFSDTFKLDKITPGYRWIELSSNAYIKTGIRRLENYENGLDYKSKGY